MARLEDVGIHLLKNREMLQHKVMKRILELQRRVPELHSNLNRLLELLCVIEMDYSVSPVDCGTNTRHHTSRTVRPTHGTGRQRVRRPQPQVLDVDLSRARALFRALLSLPLPPSLAGLCSLSSISGGYVTRHVRAGRPRAVETWTVKDRSGPWANPARLGWLETRTGRCGEASVGIAVGAVEARGAAPADSGQPTGGGD